MYSVKYTLKYGTNGRPGKGWPGRGDKGVKYGTIPGNTGRLVTLVQNHFRDGLAIMKGSQSLKLQ